MTNLESKWTYKTALGIAVESNINETHDLICVVETSKILLKIIRHKNRTIKKAPVGNLYNLNNYRNIHAEL